MAGSNATALRQGDLTAMTDEQVEELLGKLGALNPVIQAISQAEDPSGWYISVGDDDEEETLSITVVHRAEERKLVMIVGLAVPAEENQTATYEVLLTFNGLWSETRGQRMALDENGLPILLMDLTLPGLTAEMLVDATNEFATRALSWDFMLAEGGFDGTAPEDGSGEGQVQEHVLRV